jgi:hypothetical protein
LVAPWRLGNVAFERAANDITMPPPPPPVLTDPTERQISAADCRGFAVDAAA